MPGSKSGLAEQINRKALLVFPLSALFNSFSLTAILLVYGITGRSEIAANIGLVQGATLALFFAFSANARNVILSDSTGSAGAYFLRTRLWLLLPLSCATYSLSVGIGDADAALASVLILRRASEWIGEIGLAQHEARNQLKIPTQAVAAECLLLPLCLLPLISDWPLTICAIPWALTPLLALRRNEHPACSAKGNISFRNLLPHFGSTAIVGICVYVFRISIILLAGKEVAGDLFTAYAIGGIIPTIFGQAAAPTLAHRYAKKDLPIWLSSIPVGMFIVGSVLCAIAFTQPGWLAEFELSPNFFPALGISIIGGSLMCVASYLRARLLLQEGGKNVFGPDLLSNLLIATCVPFVFYVLGPDALVILYGLSGFFSLMFMAGAVWSYAGTSPGYRESILTAIGLLLTAPIFFQIKGGIFRDTAFMYDAGGNILQLPLPLSILVLFAGIALLGNYASASRSLATVFFTAVLLVISSLIIAQGNDAHEASKLILLAQFLLPMFGLVLGQMYAAATPGSHFERSALFVLSIIIPAQLIATWLQGHAQLHPKVFFFSVYQHVQYVPTVISALLIMVSQPLWSLGSKYRLVLGLLLPLGLLYIVASMNWGAFIGALLCLACFAAVHFQKSDAFRWSIAFLVMITACGGYYIALTEAATDARPESVSAVSNAIKDRRDLLSSDSKNGNQSSSSTLVPYSTSWKYYATGFVESPTAFLLGHATPPERSQHRSAHNFWLDALYNFGAVSILPIAILLATTIRSVWRQRERVLFDRLLLGTTVAAIYLILFENMHTVGMRQPYPGILTFFIWGMLIARLQPQDYRDTKFPN